jgi:hypothetical protein
MKNGGRGRGRDEATYIRRICDVKRSLSAQRRPQNLINQSLFDVCTRRSQIKSLIATKEDNGYGGARTPFYTLGRDVMAGNAACKNLINESLLEFCTRRSQIGFVATQNSVS